MINHEENLKSALNQRQQLLSELQELSNQVAMKRETVLKLQGIIEYLTGLGIEVPEQLQENIITKESNISEGANVQ